MCVDALCVRACAVVNTSRVDDQQCHDANASSSIGESCKRQVRPGCSECSDVLQLELDALLPGLHPACASVNYHVFDSTEYNLAELSNYFSHSEPEEAGALLIALALTAACLLALVLCHRLVVYSLRADKKKRADVAAGPSITREDAATAPVASGDCPPPNSPRHVPLDVLRLLGVLFIICFHLTELGLASLPEVPTRLTAALSWGVSCYPLLFLLSGFLAASRHVESASHTEVWPLLRRRGAKYYPAFLATAVAGCIITHVSFEAFLSEAGYAATNTNGAISGVYALMLPFCLSAWHPLLRLNNAANAPSFLVGAFLLNCAASLPILDRLTSASPRGLVVVLALAYAATWWQAANDCGITVLVLDRYVTFVALGASVPSHLFGMALGLLHARVAPLMVGNGASASDCADGRSLTIFACAWRIMSICGFSVLVVASAVVCAFAPHRAELPRIVSAWLRAGAGLPIFGAAVVAVIGGRDPLARLLLGFWPRRASAVLRLWLALLLCAHPAWRVAQLVVGVSNAGSEPTPLPQPAHECVLESQFFSSQMHVAFPLQAPAVAAWASAWATPPPPPPPPLPSAMAADLIKVFLCLLLAGTLATELLISQRSERRCLALLDSLLGMDTRGAASGRRASSAAHGSTVPQHTASSVASPCERLVAYFSAMFGLFAIFMTATFSDDNAEWALLADLKLAPLAVQRGLEYLSWLLVAPAFALLMGLVGQILFPPSADVAVPRIPRQSHTDDNVLLPVLYWRIVTRGLHPDLVAANVCDCFNVLEGCGLPRAVRTNFEDIKSRAPPVVSHPCPLISPLTAVLSCALLLTQRWEVEVVTDNAMGLAGRTKTDVVEIVVPSGYRPPNGCKFKARALHYAAACGASAARRVDWIVHMDEETRFNDATVAHVLAHCMREHGLCCLEPTRHASIGQGVILYNVTAIESTLCALADTIRVGDDYGKFALQYRVSKQPLIGMHGSFVVCQAAVELDFGFDHGIEGSITEGESRMWRLPSPKLLCLPPLPPLPPLAT